MQFCGTQLYHHGFDFTSASQLSFSMMSTTAWSRDGAHLWRNCWCTLKFEHHTQYRWKRCLPKQPWGLCTLNTMTWATGLRDLCACTDVAPEDKPRCCLWETHKSWAHGALTWTCIKLQHQNFYWPLRSGQKTQILKAAEKSHVSVLTHHFAQTEWLICPVRNAVSWCCSHMGECKAREGALLGQSWARQSYSLNFF